jgi:outer membrane lipoprotein-sorting protein
LTLPATPSTISLMRKFSILALLLLLPCAVRAQSADAIVARYLAARGGYDKIKAVHSERVIGTISFGGGVDGLLLVERERPLKMHMEINLNGSTMIRVYDGKSAGWIYNPFAPNAVVQSMSEAELRNIFDEADFEGPFVDYKQKGNVIEFVGRADVQGSPAFKLRLTNKNGDVGYFYFDAVTFLLLEWQGVRKVGEAEQTSESYFKDFREVEGLKYPFLIESRSPGTNQSQKLVANKIEVNMPIDAAHFAQPSPPPSPATPPPSAPADPAKP